MLHARRSRQERSECTSVIGIQEDSREDVLPIGRMTSSTARGGTMRTTGDDLRPRVVRARVRNAGPWAERDGGQCDWPQLRQGGRCLQSWVGCGSGSSAHRPSGRGFGRASLLVENRASLWPIALATPEIAPGGVCIRAGYRPVFTVQSEPHPIPPVILNSIQDLPGEGGASYEEIPTRAKRMHVRNRNPGGQPKVCCASVG
jgi:hypothetical protein